MRTCLIFVLVMLNLGITMHSHAQKFDWLNLVGGMDDKSVRAIALHDEFIYVTGEFYSPISFGSTVVTGSSNPYHLDHIFVAKYDTTGNLYWVKSFSTLRVNVVDIASDDQGNVYVLGDFAGGLDLVIGSDSLKTDKAFSAYIFSLDPSGNARWAKSLYSTEINQLNSFNTTSLSSDGENVYLTGNYADSLFYDGSFIQYGDYDGFLLKIGQSSGNLKWEKKIGISQGWQKGSDITDVYSSDGYVYITGNYVDSLLIDSLKVKTTGNYFDVYYAKIDTGGNFVWLKSSNISKSIPYITHKIHIITDASGNIYLSGMFRDEFQIDSVVVNSLGPNTRDVFLYKLSPTGNVIYGKDYESIHSLNLYDIDVGKDNNTYLTGSFNQRLVIGSDTLFGNGDMDAFVIKQDSTGKLEWAQNMGGSHGGDRGVSIESDKLGKVYVAGQYQGLSTFGTRTVTTVSSKPDIFLTRLSECGNYTAKIQAIGDTIWCGNLSNPVQLMTPTTGTGYLFQWYKGNIPLAGETYRNLFPQDSGSYSVIVNNNGCIDTSRAITITADSLPQVSLAPFPTVCANDTAFVLSGGSPIGGTWLGTGVNNGFFDPSVADTGWVEISYVYSNGTCSDTASQNIYILPVPNASINGPASVCAFSTGNTYTANSGQNLNYQWNVSGGSITYGQGTSSISVDWGVAGTGIVTLTAFRFNSVSPCDTIIVHDTIAIDNPHFNASIQGTDSVCTNVNYTYSVPSNGILYQWQVTGGQIVSGLNTSSINVKWNTAGQGTLYLRMFNSCFNDTILRDTVHIIPGVLPTITGNASVCSGSTEIYSAGTSNSTYQWSVTGGAIASGQGASSISVDWGNASAGNISLTETISNGCSGTDNLQVAINSVNTAIIQSRDTLFAQENSAIYQWLQCNLSTSGFTAIPGETSSFFIAANSGNYALEVTKNGCTDTSACMQVIITGINENPIVFEGLNIYPNPSDGLFTLEISNERQNNIQIELLDMSGKQLYHKDFYSTSSIIEKLDFSHLTKGIYFLKLNSDGEQKVEKLVIQ